MIFTLLTALLLCVGISYGSAQQSKSEYFPRHGHWVRDDFLKLYHSVKDPQRIFGYPITSVFPDRVRPGIQIQYFERARMEYDPTKPADQRVSLANLGEFVYKEDQPGAEADYSTSGMCRRFPNGKLVCYAFIQFYDANDGPVVFGQPISNAESVDGHIVQYFERARMEWRTEMPANQKVVLTELGQIDFDRHIGDNSLLKPDPSNEVQLVELQVYAFTAHPLVAAGQEQQIFVYVRDQFGNPLPNIPVMLTILTPGKQAESRRPAGYTNADGVTQDKFTVDNVQPNQVVQVTVEADIAQDLKGTAETWFRTWW